MKFSILFAAFLLSAPSWAVSTFDDVIIENSCTVPAPVNPTDATTKSYVDAAVAGATIPDATTLVKGKVKLAGDLAGTADLPTVPGLASKEPIITIGTSAQVWFGDKVFRTLNTLAVPELTNLYYTQGRFDSAFGAKSTSDLAEGSNLYYTAARFNSALSTKSTSDLAEGSNLYFTNARVDTEFDTRLVTKSTSNLAEGSNLYFTNARAQGAVSASAPLVDTAGVFSIPQSSSSVDGYLSQTDWSTFNNKAPTSSPAFTGVPTAPTAAVGTSTTQLATTAFVLSQGFQGATGSMPNAGSTTLVSTTSASTTFVNALTTPITVTATSAPIIAKCVLDMTSATAASVATVRVTVNAVSGGSVTESLTTATTQHLTVANQNLSAALGPGTYTVNCDFNRASGTGTVTVGQGSLTAVALQGTSSNGITSLSGLGLAAGPGSGAQSLTGILNMAGGGLNANNTAVNGGIAYSTASAINLSAAGLTGQILRSAGAAAPTWTAETFPAFTTINQILYSSAANVVSGLATANTGVVVTGSTGVPSVTSCSTANRVLRTNGTTVSCAQLNLGTDVVTVPSQRIPFGNGTGLVTDANFIYDTTNTRFSVGGSGTAAINAIVASGSHTALQAYNSSAGNAFQSTNVSGYTAALINRSASAATGASIGMEFGRGTPAAPTGALSGDQIGVIAATPDASDGNAYGYSSAISFVASENALTTSTGGEIALSTTPNGGNLVPVERARVTNDGQLKAHYGVSVDTSTAQPTCDSSHRGLWWVIQGGAGVADVLQICLKDAADAYGWVTK